MKIKGQSFNELDLAFLQSYLLELFKHENKCADNLNHTEWYLAEKYSPEVISDIINYLQKEKIKCDCDLIKLDLAEKVL